MTEHYFSRQPSAASRPIEIEVALRDRRFRFRTDRGVFSYGRLDRGTRLLIETMEIGAEDTVLDWGCGYGAIGVVAATLAASGFVYLVDPNRRAVELARANLRLNRIRNARARRSDDLDALSEMVFDVVASNPPLRAGWKVVGAMMEQAHDHLGSGGRLYLVARTDKGAKTLARRLGERFGEVSEVAKRGGYRVYVAAKQETARTSEGV